MLDVESQLSDDALAQLAPGGPPSMARAMLLEVTAVTVLSFAMTADGLADVCMASVTDPVPERDMLLGVEAELSALGPDGLVVTHNGVAHDARLIARRCMRHWLDAPFAFALVEAGPDRHFDTMLRFGGRAEGRAGGSLVDLCAGLGVPAALPPSGRRREVHPLVRKGQFDVALTAVAFLHWEAARRRSPRWLAAAWRDLARHLLEPGVRADHLMPLARRGLELGDALAAARR